MIGRLTGALLEVDGALLTVDVQGVGYEVEVAASVLITQPQAGSELTLYTHFVVREDAQLLFGFATRAERDLFRAYIKINGVGPKLALALISSVDSASLTQAVQHNDVSVLTRVPGVGKKTAERLMVELKNRLDSLAEISGASLAVVREVGNRVERAVEMEAEDALVALGYRPADAARAVASVMADLDKEQSESATVEEIVRQTLRTFAQAKLNA